LAAALPAEARRIASKADNLACQRMEAASVSEIEGRFRRVEPRLDALLDGCVAGMVARGVSVVDESNRGGFDWVGPNYVWRYLFEDVSRTGAQVERVAVGVTYTEPWEPEPVVCLEILRFAETFQVGQPSAWRESASQKLRLDEIESRTLFVVVTEELLGGRAALAARHHAG
jgi:hypothetical protein